MRIRLVLTVLAFAGLASAQPPSIRTSDPVLNGASFQTGVPLTGGSLVSIFGTRLASSMASADSIPLAASLGGASVQFVNGSTKLNAPMLYAQPDGASPSQINCQVPWNLVPNNSTATVSVIVTRDGVASPPAQVTVGPASPGVFFSNGRAVAVNLDGTLVWPANLIPNFPTHGAKPGDVIIVYATGLGAVDSPIADGAASLDKLRNTLVAPIVLIGGVQAPLAFSGLAPQFVGVNQLNVVIPDIPPNDNAPFQLQMGGFTTSDQITISVTK